MHLRVLVDRAVDPDQQSCLLKGLQVFVKIGVLAIGHWMVMFFSRMIRPHFAWSLRTRAAIVSAGPPTTSQPCASSFSRIAASEITLPSSACRRSSTERGVPAGANRPIHDSDS